MGGLALIGAIAFDPTIRGVLVVVVSTTVLLGSIFMILATNSGVRVGFLVAASGFFAWMFLIFGAILLVTAWGVLRDARHGGHAVEEALLPEDLGDAQLLLGARDSDDRVRRVQRVADPSQHVGDGISHGHGCDSSTYARRNGIPSFSSRARPSSSVEAEV